LSFENILFTCRLKSEQNCSGKKTLEKCTFH